MQMTWATEMWAALTCWKLIFVCLLMPPTWTHFLTSGYEDHAMNFLSPKAFLMIFSYCVSHASSMAYKFHTSTFNVFKGIRKVTTHSWKYCTLSDLDCNCVFWLMKLKIGTGCKLIRLGWIFSPMWTETCVTWQRLITRSCSLEDRLTRSATFHALTCTSESQEEEGSPQQPCITVGESSIIVLWTNKISPHDTGS